MKNNFLFLASLILITAAFFCGIFFQRSITGEAQKQAEEKTSQVNIELTKTKLKTFSNNKNIEIFVNGERLLEEENEIFLEQ